MVRRQDDTYGVGVDIDNDNIRDLVVIDIVRLYLSKSLLCPTTASFQCIRKE